MKSLVAATLLLLSGSWGSHGALASPPDGWSEEDLPVAFIAADLWCVNPSEVYLSGQERPDQVGLICRRSQAAWECFPEPPEYGALYSLWGSPWGDLVAVGYRSTILAFDGRTWMPQEHPPTGHLRDVWGTGPNNIYAVGDGGAVLRYDGTAWTTHSSPTGAQLEAVWADQTGRTTCVYVTGAGGDIFGFDGDEWREIPAPAAFLTGLWGTSCDDFYATGHLGALERGVFYHCNGSECMRICEGQFGGFPQVPQLWEVGGNRSDVYASGGFGVIAHWDGTVCTALDSGIDSFLYATCSNNPRDIYVAGVEKALHAVFE